MSMLTLEMLLLSMSRATVARTRMESMLERTLRKSSLVAGILMFPLMMTQPSS